MMSSNMNNTNILVLEENKMKKLLALVLAALMIFAMAACTPAEPNSGDNESGDNQQVDSDAKVVKIGIFEPASGDNGAGGKPGNTRYPIRKQHSEHS